MATTLAPLITNSNSLVHGMCTRGANRLAPMKERTRNLTTADKEAARRLRALWDAAAQKRKAEGHPLTQDVMAERLARATGRGTQGLVSQYLNGYIALNYRALLAFADEVGFDPAQVRQDLPEQQLQHGVRALTPMAAEGVPQSAGELDLLRSVAVAQGLLVKVLAESMPPIGAAYLQELRKVDPAVRNGAHVQTLIGALRHEFATQGARRQRSAAQPPAGGARQKRT